MLLNEHLVFDLLGVFMSEEYNVSVTLKMYLEDFSKSTKVTKYLSSLCKVVKVWEEDIGFGIKVLKASILVKDDKGGTDALEEKLNSHEGIKQVEIEDISRI